MRIFCFGEERAGFGEFFQHREIGGGRFLRREVLDRFEAAEADEVGGDLAVVEVATVVADRTVDGEFVVEPGKIVVSAVARRGVDGTGAAVGRDVVSEDDGRGAVDERMARGQSLQGLPANDRDPRPKVQCSECGIGFLGGVDDRWGECLCDDDALGTEVGDDVVHCGVKRDREVGGDRPRCGGPDDDEEGFVGGEAEFLRFAGGHAELHPDGDRDVVLVFDLGFGERGLERNAPVNGLLAAVNQALGNEGREGADDVGFKGRGFGFIFVRPVGEHAEAFELGGLGCDP